MVPDIAYKPTFPFSKEVAAGIVHVPKPPTGIGFEYFCKYAELIVQNATASTSSNYKVPKNKVLYITDVQMSIYCDNFFVTGLQGYCYGRITTNDVINYISFMMIRGGRNNSTKGGDSSDHMTLSFPLPLRIASNSTINFLISKSSTLADSIAWGFYIIHGYLLRK